LEKLPKPPKTLQTPPPILNPPKPFPPIALHSFHLFLPFFTSPPLSSPQNSQREPKRKFTARKFGPGLKILSYMLYGDHGFFFHDILEKIPACSFGWFVILHTCNKFVNLICTIMKMLVHFL